LIVMIEKPESDEFEDDEPTDVIGTEDIDVDRVMRDIDLAKRRGQKVGDLEAPGAHARRQAHRRAHQ
jgi:hypothetical protein